MKTENAILMRQARESLSGKWGLAIGAGVVYCLIVGVLGGIPKVGGLISLIITGPMMLGAAIFSLSLSRKKDAEISQLFDGFKRFSKSFVAYLLMVLFVFLWTLLLIVPGIIAAFSYSQLFYILAEDNSISAGDALKKSKKMMFGYKWKYFCLLCRFIGWGLLSILTLGIGFLWLIPYIQISMVKFYDDVSVSSPEKTS